MSTHGQLIAWLFRRLNTAELGLVAGCQLLGRTIEMHLFLLLAIIGLIQPAWADMPVTSNVQQSVDDQQKTCKEKLADVCPGIKPGGSRIQKCLLSQYMSMADVCPERAAKQQHKQDKKNDGQPGTAAPVAKPNGMQ